MTSRRNVLAAASALAIAPALSTAWAQQYPAKPIKIVIGFAAGGSLDLNARHVAQRLTQVVGQQVVIENRPGASGQIAMQHIMGAPADGYTLILLSAGTTIASARPTPPFDVRRDVAPVAGMATGPLALYVSAASPVKTLAEFVQYASQRPGALNYASTGIGSLQHLLFSLLMQRTGVQLVHIPYKGSPQSTLGVIGNEVQVGMDTLVALTPHLESGKVRVLALTTASGAGGLPGMKEAGIDGFDFTSWSMFAVPPKTPGKIIDYLSKTFDSVYRDPELKAHFARNGQTVLEGGPAQLTELLGREVAQWNQVIDKAGIVFS